MSASRTCVSVWACHRLSRHRPRKLRPTVRLARSRPAHPCLVPKVSVSRGHARLDHGLADPALMGHRRMDRPGRMARASVAQDHRDPVSAVRAPMGHRRMDRPGRTGRASVAQDHRDPVSAVRAPMGHRRMDRPGRTGRASVAQDHRDPVSAVHALMGHLPTDRRDRTDRGSVDQDHRGHVQRVSVSRGHARMARGSAAHARRRQWQFLKLPLPK